MIANPLEWDRIAARVRGLTLTRPWPWAFAHAGKRVENRTWKPSPQSAPQWIALHAGRGFDSEVIDMFRCGEFGAAARGVPVSRRDHVESAIVALARLGAVRTLCDCCHTYTDGGRVADPWTFGPVAWCFDRVLILREPVPCRGFQGLWRPAEPVIELLRVAAVDDAPNGGSTT
jgi:hypothetical protein